MSFKYDTAAPVAEQAAQILEQSGFAPHANAVRSLIEANRRPSPCVESALESLTRCASEIYRAPYAEIRGDARTHNVALARHMVSYVAFAYCEASLAQIAKFFGRDDSTVKNSLRRAVQEMTSLGKPGLDARASVAALRAVATASLRRSA